MDVPRNQVYPGVFHQLLSAQAGTSFKHIKNKPGNSIASTLRLCLLIVSGIWFTGCHSWIPHCSASQVEFPHVFFATPLATDAAWISTSSRPGTNDPRWFSS